MLKKCLISLIILLMSSAFALADKIPYSSKSIKHYGIGLLKIDSDFDIYDRPENNAKVLKHITLPIDKNKSAIVQESKKSINPYVVSIPSQKQFFASIYEYPEKNWVQIYYNQNGKEIGWVKMPEKSNFMTWKEFIFKYGKKNGIVLMKDVPTSQYKLYAQDIETAQVVDEFTYPEYIALRIIRGNWALITVVDTGMVYKTGWFRWRTDDGKLRVFPKMKE